MIIFTILFLIFLLSFVVVIHEAGHLIVAKLLKVKVLEYSIGFGPALIKHKDKHGTLWKFTPFLLGGYVKLFGFSEKTVKNIPENERKYTFYYQHPLKKILIITAGALNNLITAIIIAFILYFFIGIPTSNNIVNTSITNDILKDDKIIAVNNIKVTTWRDIKNAVNKINGKTNIHITIERQDKIINTTIPVQIIDNKIGQIYVLPFQPYPKSIFQKFSLLESLKLSYKKTLEFSAVFGKAFYLIIKGELDNKLTGNKKFLEQFQGDITLYKIYQALFIFYFMNIALFIFNILPIPFLDGSFFVIHLSELILKKTIPENVVKVIMVAWACLLFYFVAF